MSDAAQIEQKLSMQAAQLMRAAIMIARALAAREAAARRAAARASLEHARALRTVTEQQRRLAVPLYRAARREGWWDDPKVSAAERARAVGLATRFEQVDEDARAVALEARQRLERQARAHEQEQERARLAARNPETFRDSGKEAFVDMTLVSVAELAAAAPLVDGEKLEQSLEEILEGIRADPQATNTQVSDSVAEDVAVAAPKPGDKKLDLFAAYGLMTTQPVEPLSVGDLDRPDMSVNVPAWDSAEARQAWAAQLLDAGIDADGVRAFTVASQAQPGPAQDMLATSVNVPAGRVPAAPLEDVHTLHR